MSIDPASEVVTFNGETVAVDWVEVSWDGAISGVHQPHTFITAHANPSRTADAVVVEQRLFEIRYTDYFGNSAFAVAACIDGWHAPDWSDYLLQVRCSGGGNVDGGFSCGHEFDRFARCLTVHVRQRINSKRIVKTAAFRFVHDGQSFRLKPATD